MRRLVSASFAAALLAACGPGDAQTPPAPAATGAPVQTRPPNADFLKPAFPGQTRAPGVRSEAALTAGYEIGRRAVEDGISLLDLVGVHHVVLAEILDDPPSGGSSAVTRAASEFLVEVLATYDMAHRSLDRSPGVDAPHSHRTTSRHGRCARCRPCAPAVCRAPPPPPPCCRPAPRRRPRAPDRRRPPYRS